MLHKNVGTYIHLYMHVCTTYEQDTVKSLPFRYDSLKMAADRNMLILAPNLLLPKK